MPLEHRIVVQRVSLPSRERGLKSQELRDPQLPHLSLPSRERGLKSVDQVKTGDWIVSLPSRERGLKSWWLPLYLLH